MYDHRLDTFLKAAEYGSFSKAAEALFITPSAVIQQINLLEKELNARLFERSARGAALTQSGRILAEYAQKFITTDRELREQLAKSARDAENRFLILTDFLHKPRYFHRLWKRYGAAGAVPQPLSGDFRAQEELPADLVEYVVDGEPWQGRMSFLRLTNTPVALAVPPGHSLWEKEKLTTQDLRGQTIFTIRQGSSPELDSFAEFAAAHGAAIRLVEMYDISVFSQCEAEDALLQLPLCWADLYPSFRVLTGDWPYSLTYGFFYREDGPEALMSFIRKLRSIPGEELKTLLGLTTR